MNVNLAFHYPRILLILCCLCLIVTPLAGQALKGTLLGTVIDTSGAAVPDADVKATEVNTNIVRVTKTNETGPIHFP